MQNNTNIPVIQTENLSKSFGSVHAVKGLTLRIDRGEAVALLGPNGAGKTTFVEMLEGLQSPDAGEIRLFGMPWKGNENTLRSKLGIALQETRLVDTLTVKETLELFASFYGLGASRVEEVLDLVAMREKKGALTGKLSGGQRQRLAVGLGLLNDPELLLLDEPTTGLDPGARKDIWDLISLLLKKGHTLLLTTHYMEEAEMLCQRVVFMSKGSVLLDEPLKNLRERGSLNDLFVKLSGENLDG
ncbi:MAG: ABC transporter ATP-binding protein [candidate division FCPU426 bacterium]